MTKTIRVTDQDYDRVVMVRDMTGLSTAQAARYVFHRGTDLSGDRTFRERLEDDMELAISSHPEYGERNPDALLSLVDFREAKSLYDPVTSPHFQVPFSDEPDQNVF